MSTAEEATINPDGSTTFEDASGGADYDASGGANYENTTFDDSDGIPNMDEQSAEEIIKGTDPALYLAIAVACFVVIFVFIQIRKNERMPRLTPSSRTSTGTNSTSRCPQLSMNITKSKKNARRKGGSLGRVVVRSLLLIIVRWLKL